MEIKIQNGDYVPDGLGGVVRLSGAEALLERILFRLTARRGGLPPLPALGSRLHLLGREPASHHTDRKSGSAECRDRARMPSSA